MAGCKEADGKRRTRHKANISHELLESQEKSVGEFSRFGKRCLLLMSNRTLGNDVRKDVTGKNGTDAASDFRKESHLRNGNGDERILAITNCRAKLALDVH
jgi:hypothetical protein